MYNANLKTFLKVADSGSLTQVAQDENTSPSLILKQIRQLEIRLGLPLFYRTNKGSTLTAAGRMLYTDIKFLIEFCDNAVARAKRAMEAEYDQTITVSVTNDAGLIVSGILESI